MVDRLFWLPQMMTIIMGVGNVLVVRGPSPSVIILGTRFVWRGGPVIRHICYFAPLGSYYDGFSSTENCKVGPWLHIRGKNWRFSD